MPSRILIIHCILQVIGNNAVHGGAIYVGGNGYGELTMGFNCSISNNYASIHGGGIAIGANSYSVIRGRYEDEVMDVVISSNSAGVQGGGVYSRGDMSLGNILVKNNWAPNGGIVCTLESFL